MVDRLAPRAEGRPRENGCYRIYHFYARDPEDRNVEFQHCYHLASDIQPAAIALLPTSILTYGESFLFLREPTSSLYEKERIERFVYGE